MSTVIEKCPFCGREHTMGEYQTRSEVRGIAVSAPYDVQCECGTISRWSVPLFKVTASGYVLRHLREGETPFLPVAIHVMSSPHDDCEHVWPDLNGQTDDNGVCEKCGTSFMAYVHGD